MEPKFRRISKNKADSDDADENNKIGGTVPDVFKSKKASSVKQNLIPKRIKRPDFDGKLLESRQCLIPNRHKCKNTSG